MELAAQALYAHEQLHAAALQHVAVMKLFS